MLSLAINIITIKNKQNIALDLKYAIFIWLCLLTFAPIYCKIYYDIKMKWGGKENLIAVIALYKIGTEKMSVGHGAAYASCVPGRCAY